MDEKIEKSEKLKKELKGMGIGVLGVFLLIALLSFNANDLSFNSYSSEAGVRNFGGRLGAQVADLFLQVFGVASYLIPCSLIYFAYRLLRFKEFSWRYYKGIAFLGLLVSLSALFAFNMEFTLFLGQRVPTGGFMGFKTAELLRKRTSASPARSSCCSPCWLRPSWSSPASPSSCSPTGGSARSARNGAVFGKDGR